MAHQGRTPHPSKAAGADGPRRGDGEASDERQLDGALLELVRGPAVAAAGIGCLHPCAHRRAPARR